MRCSSCGGGVFNGGSDRRSACENGELAPPSAEASPEVLYDELVGALLDVQDLIPARAPAGAHCRPEDGPLYRRVFAALQKAAA